MPTSKTTSVHIANLFFNLGLIRNGITPYLLTTVYSSRENVSHFYAPCFGVKHLTVRAYHPQFDDQAERLKKTILSCPRQFVARLQKERGTIEQSLKHLFNTQLHRNMNQVPLSPVLNRHPHGHTLSCANHVVPTEACGDISPQLLYSRLEACIYTLLWILTRKNHNTDVSTTKIVRCVKSRHLNHKT